MNHPSRPHDPHRRLLTLAALALAAPRLAAQQPSPATIAAEEAQAPPLPALGSLLRVPAIDLLNGQRWAQQPGRPLLVYWWASHCPFCALQSPAMERLWRQVQSRGWQWLAPSIGRRADDERAYLARRGYTFPAAWTTAEWRRQFPKPKGLPITLLADAQGRIVLAEAGQMFDEDVAAIARLF